MGFKRLLASPHAVLPNVALFLAPVSILLGIVVLCLSIPGPHTTMGEMILGGILIGGPLGALIPELIERSKK